MRPRDHRLRLGLVATMLGGALLLGACSRDSAATETPAGAKGTASPSRSVTPSAAPSVSARPSASASAALSSNPPSAPPSASVAPASAASSSASAAPIGGKKYVVEAGDTLGVIAEKFGVTIQQLIETNKLANPDFLTVGQELIIPGR